MAWRKRTLELEDGTLVEIECGDRRCDNRRTNCECPALRSGVGSQCKYGFWTCIGERTLACRRAEARANKKVDAAPPVVL